MVSHDAPEQHVDRSDTAAAPAGNPRQCSVLVVTYNSSSTIRACLPLLLGMPQLEVIVVDNNSADGTAAILSQEFPSVQLITLSENVGFARACNIGVSASQGSLVLLLNPDTVASQDAVGTLFEFLAQHPRAGIAGARLLDGAGRPLQSMGNRPSVLGCILDKPLALVARVTPVQGMMRRLLGTLSAKYRLPDGPERVAWVSGAALCCNRTAWDQAGGFDGAFFLYHEDVDLCLRIADMGWEVWHVPQAVIVHQSGASFGSDRAHQRHIYYASQRYLLRKHQGKVAASLAALLQGFYRRLGLYRQFATDRIGRPFSATPGRHP